MDKVFQKLWNGFRRPSSVSMKYCIMRKKKTLVIYRICITTALDRFLNKEKWYSQVIWMFSTFREYCLPPEKQMRSHCSLMHTFEEKTFLSLLTERHAVIIWAKFKFIWYLHSILFISVTITDWSYGIYIFYKRHIYRDMQMQ